MQPLKARPGRPRKFDKPSRPITVTLPEEVIVQLANADGGGDLGRGIVSLVEQQRGVQRTSPPMAEIFRYGSRAVIIVPMLNALNRLPGVQLIPIGGGRALISLEKPHAIPQLELVVRDAAEHTRADSSESETLRSVADILRKARVSRGVALIERTIIVLEPRRRRRRA